MKNSFQFYTDTVFEQETGWESNVLDANGEPFLIKKEPRPIGFKLKKKENLNEQET